MDSLLRRTPTTDLKPLYLVEETNYSDRFDKGGEGYEENESRECGRSQRCESNVHLEVNLQGKNWMQAD